MGLKDTITKKAHASSVKKLKANNVPDKIVSSLSVSFMEDIADALSEVTQSIFNYTGGLDVSNEQVEAKFTSSETSNVIKMIVSYNSVTDEEKYTFDNLNQTIEDNIKPEEEPKPKETKEEPKKTVRKKPVTKKKVAPKEEIKEEVKISAIPNFTKMVDTAIEIGNKEKEEEKIQKVKEMVDNSLESLNKIEKADKINKILDALQEQVTEEKKEDKLLSILKNV